MRSMFRIPTAALLAATLLAAPTFAATATTKAAATTTHKAPPKLTIESLPEAVQKTVHAESDGAVIRDISKEKSEDGKWVYEIETMVKDMSHDYIVGEDGTVLTSERQVTLESMPEAARATLTKAAGKSTIRIIESVTKAGKLEYYEAQVGSTKASKEIKVSPAGAIVK